jgi:hypothetical protein
MVVILPLQSFENQQYGFGLFSCKSQTLTPHTCTLLVNCKTSKKEPSPFPSLNSSIQLISLNPSTIEQLQFFLDLDMTHKHNVASYKKTIALHIKTT